MKYTQMFIGFFGEGTTDYRFLMPVIENSLKMIFEKSNFDIDFNLIEIHISKSGLSFPEQVAEAAKKAHNDYGVSLLIIHADADSETHERALSERIEPAINYINSIQTYELCKEIVPIIPVHETEAWMLADTDLIRRKIGTVLSVAELRLPNNPERVSRPKELLQRIIEQVQASRSKRRRREMTISDLYQPIGSELDVKLLKRLTSFSQFYSNLEQYFKPFIF